MKVDFSKLDRAFNPRCVVVVGDKKESNFFWLRAQSTFKGKLYSVQVSPGDIKGIEELGIKNYASLMDVPDPIDLAIVAVPRAVAPRILDDCINKEVAVAQFFTSGFAETGSEEGRRLEALLTEKAKQANFHLVGPNCMGIFSPEAGVRQAERQYAGSAGPVGFISQSGTHAITFSLEAHLQGVDINKSVSFGNGIALDSPDYLEYFSADEDIKVIGMYLEGVRDGKRFLSVLRKVCARKPVVIWKGGRTEAGGRAIASHTGSLAVAQAVWDAAIRQCGAIKVTNQEELIDTLAALLYLSPVHGERVAIAGGSGGQSVAIADAFAEAGLKVPILTQGSYDKLATFFNLVGASYRNPIDPGANRKEMAQIMEILEQDDNIDNLVLLMTARSGWHTPGELQSQINSVVNIRKRALKPVMVILNFSISDGIQYARDISLKLQEGGVPVFATVERGAHALKNALGYYNT